MCFQRPGPRFATFRNHGVRRASGIMHNSSTEKGIVPDFDRRGSRVARCFAFLHSFARASSSSVSGTLAATHGMFRRGSAELHEVGNRRGVARACRIRTGDMRGTLLISRQRYFGPPELRLVWCLVPLTIPIHRPPPPFSFGRSLPRAPHELGCRRQVQHGIDVLGA